MLCKRFETQIGFNKLSCKKLIKIQLIILNLKVIQKNENLIFILMN